MGGRSHTYTFTTVDSAYMLHGRYSSNNCWLFSTNYMIMMKTTIM